MNGARCALPARRPTVRPRLAALLLLATTPFATAAGAGAMVGGIAGRLGSPTDYVPALVVHAWSEATGRLASVATAPGQTSYLLAVPPGRYLVFATPADPGAPPVHGAHTRFTLCARDARRLESGACGDHGLVEVEVGRRRVDGVDISDWYLEDAAVARIDRVLGRRSESWTEATLAAPKFSEYPAPTAATGAPVIAGARAANFAGGWLLERTPCASVGAATGGCENVTLTELATGRMLRPEPLAGVPAAEPCAGVKVLQYRRDSRLLTVTTARGDELVTRYLVWNPTEATLRTVATLSSTVAERCGE
ncbi:MAG: hypothetical protein ACK53C_07030 [Pseudomonadota bacterium]